MKWILTLALLLAVGCRGPAATALAPSPEPATQPPPTIGLTATNPPAVSPGAATTANSATVTSSAAIGAATQTATQPAAEAETQAATEAANAAEDPAVKVVLAYLEARAEADVAAVSDLACAAWRSQAITEAISFRGMQAELQDVLCAPAGVAGAYTLVSCSGKIITTYGGETREWDLETFVYQTVAEDDAWKMCGYHS